MKTITMSSTPGMGTIHNSKVELEDSCDKVFYFYTSQLEIADVKPSPDIRLLHTPEYITYIKENPNKKVGIILDSRAGKYAIRDMIFAELDAMDSSNVTTHNVIMMA